MKKINEISKKYGLEEGTSEKGKNTFKYENLAGKVIPIKDKNGQINHYEDAQGNRISKEEAFKDLETFEQNVNKWKEKSYQNVQVSIERGQSINRLERTGQKDAAYDAILNGATEAIENTVNRANELLKDSHLDNESKQKIEKAKQDFFESIANSLNSLGIKGDYQNQLDKLRSQGKGKTNEAQVLKDIINGKNGYDKEIAEANDKIKNAKDNKQLTIAKRQKTLAENKQKIYEEKINAPQDFDNLTKEYKKEPLKSSK